MSTYKIAKTVRFHQTGSADVLTIESLQVNEPKENEVRIKVEAIGLNRAEIMFRTGTYLETAQLPSKLGYEAAGIIESVGSEVTAFKVGEKVSTIPAFSMSQYGVYAELAVVPADAVTTYPKHFSPVEASAIWMQYVTAYGALIDLAKIKPQQTVLITAASSSVGVAAIQIARSIGCTVIACSRGDAKKPFLLELGADHVICTDTESLTERVADITDGAGANLIFDPIGGPLLSQLAEAASTNAMIVEYGALDTRETPYPLFPALAKGLTIKGYTLFEITQDSERLAQAKDFINLLFEREKLAPIIDATFEFDNIVDAHTYMESNQQKGKIVVTL